MIPGVDVSYYQGVMDWQKAATRAKFAIIRAGSINGVTGVCYEDYQWQSNKSAVTILPCGFYWFFRPEKSAATQAKYFLDLVRPVIGGGGQFTYPALYCDIELPGQAAVVRAFCELVRKEYAIGIYSSAGKLPLLTGDKSWMAAYPFWMADWTPPYPVPAPFTDWLILQTGKYSPASDYGASLGKEIDVNTAKDALIPVTPLPEPDTLVERVASLEALTIEMDKILDRHGAWLTDLETRFKGGVPFVYFVPNGGSCVIQHAAKWYKTSSGVDKPIFAPVGDGAHPRVSGKAKVFPLPVTGDGGQVCYMLLDQVIDGETVYVRRQDGEIKAGA